MKIKENIRRIVQINDEMMRLKAEKDVLDVFFLELAEKDLRDKKTKTVAYSADGAKVVATLAKKVTMQYPMLISTVFGAMFKDIAKEEINQTLTTPGKRILGNICSGEFVRQSVEEVIEQIAPATLVPVLLKKVKGKVYETDIKNLMAITGCSYEQAAENAFLVAEAAVWQEFRRVLMANKICEEKWQEMIDTIKVGVVVEETPKIRVDCC